MKKRVLAAIASIALVWGCASSGAPAQTEPARQATSGPALYVARDADSAIYLYGTIHLRRDGEPWGSPDVEAALARSEEIWTELEISPEAEAQTQQLAMQSGIAPAGRPLSSWLTPDENQRLAATAQRFGLQAQQLEPLQPWFAALTLTVLPMMQAGYNPQAGVDRAIDAFGDANGKRMRAFETPQQQIGFFANLSPELQRQMLVEAIDEADRGAEMLDQMSAAWERGDVSALETLLNEQMRDEYPEVYAVLITQRNQAWVATLVQELGGSGVDFVGVGAAHLVGPDGLVAQLRARGVTVERVGAPG
jgi:uncharacterized protein